MNITSKYLFGYLSEVATFRILHKSLYINMLMEIIKEMANENVTKKQISQICLV